MLRVCFLICVLFAPCLSNGLPQSSCPIHFWDSISLDWTDIKHRAQQVLFGISNNRSFLLRVGIFTCDEKVSHSKWRGFLTPFAFPVTCTASALTRQIVDIAKANLAGSLGLVSVRKSSQFIADLRLQSMFSHAGGLVLGVHTAMDRRVVNLDDRHFMVIELVQRLNGSLMAFVPTTCEENVALLFSIISDQLEVTNKLKSDMNPQNFLHWCDRASRCYHFWADFGGSAGTSSIILVIFCDGAISDSRYPFCCVQKTSPMKCYTSTLWCSCPPGFKVCFRKWCSTLVQINVKMHWNKPLRRWG